MPHADSPATRGAPRPLHAEDVKPPAHFTDEQLACWLEAVQSRPGLWTSADLVYLEAWAVAAAFIRAAHAAGGVADPQAYKNALRALQDTGRVLRITVYDRAAPGGRVALPAHGGEASELESGRVHERTPPWHRHEAGHA